MNSEIAETVLYLTLLLLPGYVTLWVILHNYPYAELKATNSQYVLWSVIDITLLSPMYIIVKNNLESDGPLYWLSTFLISLVGGLMIGYVVSVLKEKNLFKSLYKVDDCPTAWDRLFFGLKGRTMITIELVDGKVIASNWDKDSIASKAGKDIFLSSYYTQSNEGVNCQTGKWEFVNSGIWVNGNSITCLIINGGGDFDEER